jgi:hypothetical protein
LSFRHQNENGVYECGQGNGKTNFDVKKLLVKMISICQSLTTKQIPTLECALCSPDLTPWGLFLSPELRSSLRRTNFQSTEGIHKKMAEFLKSLSQSEFRRCFEAWNARVGWFVASDENYFEGNNI